MQVWRMRTGISIFLKPVDRRRLSTVVRDRNAFDWIELNGDDLRRDLLEVRMATLASMLAKATTGIRLNRIRPPKMIAPRSGWPRLLDRGGHLVPDFLEEGKACASQQEKDHTSQRNTAHPLLRASL